MPATARDLGRAAFNAAERRRAVEAAREVATGLGVAGAPARLLTAGSTSWVFEIVPAAAVVSLHPGPVIDADRMRLAAARLLAQVPYPQPHPHSPDPVPTSNGMTALVWQRVTVSAGAPDWTAVGRALRRLHRTPVSSLDGLEPILRAHCDLATLADRIEATGARGLAGADRRCLRQVLQRLAGELADAEDSRADTDFGLVHGDLHRPNILTGIDGVYLCDLDLLGAGPPQVDLAPMVDPRRPGSLGPAEVAAFEEGYQGPLPPPAQARTFNRLAHLHRTVDDLLRPGRDSPATLRDRWWTRARLDGWHAMLADWDLDLQPVLGDPRSAHLGRLVRRAEYATSGLGVPKPHTAESVADAAPRVIVLDHTAVLSGAELALARILPSLREHAHVRVLLAEHGPLEVRLGDLGVPVQILPMGTGLKDLRREVVLSPAAARQAIEMVRYVLALARLLRRERPDLVHTNSLKSALYGGVAGRLARVPVVWHIHDRIAEDYLPPPVVRLVRVLARLLPTAVIVNSDATLGTLPRPAQVVSNPVVPGEVAPATAQARTGLRIGIVGRLSPWKGQDVFLRAFALAFSGEPECQARLIGSALFGEDDVADALHALAAELGIADQVDFRGFRDDVWAELAELDILVHASVVPEPFGQVVVEGMAAGLAVIAADEAGPREVLTPEHDGLLVPPRDPVVLAEAMRRLAHDPELRARLGAAGVSTATAYTPERAAAQIASVYQAILQDPGRSPTRRRRGLSPTT
ncbi:MAG: glycosyltransferase [Actinomycetales bacterium]